MLITLAPTMLLASALTGPLEVLGAMTGFLALRSALVGFVLLARSGPGHRLPEISNAMTIAIASGVPAAALVGIAATIILVANR